ncbi:MAG: DUF2283 domain-containing protein [Methanophagales archaeon]|nr:DUF2283 domain-containing protein [Methanophagales archaeon]
MEGEIISRCGNVEWDYDGEVDVLYISFGKPRPAIGVDIGNGVILRYDEKEKEMVGMTIIGLKGMLKDFVGEKE